MDKYKFLKELLGDDSSEFIAKDLKETYIDLKQYYNDVLEDKCVPNMFSQNKDDELYALEDMINSIVIVHSYYSVEPITKGLN